VLIIFVKLTIFVLALIYSFIKLLLFCPSALLPSCPLLTPVYYYKAKNKVKIKVKIKVKGLKYLYKLFIKT
jgi:hypothetical protein